MFEFQKPRYSVEEFCELTDLARATFYRRVREGRIQVSKDGHRTFVLAEELKRYVEI